MIGERHAAAESNAVIVGGAEDARDGTVFTSPRGTYWANGTDEIREIGFTVECP